MYVCAKVSIHLDHWPPGNDVPILCIIYYRQRIGKHSIRTTFIVDLCMANVEVPAVYCVLSEILFLDTHTQTPT